MKHRILALILALVLIPSFALAAGDTFKTYTDTSVGYQIGFPSDWTEMSRETVDEVLQMAMDGKIEGMDGSVLQTYADQLKAIDSMVMFIGANGTNINVNTQDVGTELTNAHLIEMMVPPTLEQLKTVYTTMDVLVDGELYAAGTNEFVRVAFNYEVAGQSGYMVQLYGSHGTQLYVMTFTMPMTAETDQAAFDEIVQQVAATFVAPTL